MDLDFLLSDKVRLNLAMSYNEAILTEDAIGLGAGAVDGADLPGGARVAQPRRRRHERRERRDPGGHLGAAPARHRGRALPRGHPPSRLHRGLPLPLALLDRTVIIESSKALNLPASFEGTS